MASSKSFIKESNLSVKHSGQVFTPGYLVKIILDEVGYTGPAILGKHCVDNSCGDGAFLIEVVRRYVNEYHKLNGSLNGVEKDLAKYIHGIEIDPVAHQNCRENLANECKSLCVANVNFDLILGDALKYRDFDNKMDFVVGNPPYVRVHNLDDSYSAVKSYTFASDGMTDLFLVFFEIGFKMLNEHGKLSYITPSSWLGSVAGNRMRNYIRHRHNLRSVIDLEHFQAFKATTYTLISSFSKGTRFDKVEYSVFDGESLAKRKIEALGFEDFDFKDSFYFSNKMTLKQLREVFNANPPHYTSVKNGFATLADNVFIGNLLPFSELTIPVIKASTGAWYRAFFPYDNTGKPLDRDRVFNIKAISDYLSQKKTELLKNRAEADNPGWFLYGRTQALKDVCKDKLAINTTIKDAKSIKINYVPAGSGLYSGLYILSDIDFDIIKEVLISDDFVSYIASLKNYKSGGYYTFSSKDLEKFLNYKIQQQIENGRITINRQESGVLDLRF